MRRVLLTPIVSCAASVSKRWMVLCVPHAFPDVTLRGRLGAERSDESTARKPGEREFALDGGLCWGLGSAPDGAPAC